MDEDIGDDDIYAQQLKEVFNSCDLQSKGHLNRNELIDLSHKLQLGDQVPDLLKEILGDQFSDGKVTFEEFKEGFVNILANAIDCLDDVTDDQSDWSDIGDRISLAATPDIFGKEKVFGSSPVHSNRKTSTPNSAAVAKLGNKNQHQSDIRSAYNSDSGNGEGDSDEAVQLRQIWDDLAVGESGYLNLLQLSIVCEHIGMEGMAGDELELLFSELDKNGDGLVSFDEFLEGLFLTNKRPLSSRSSSSNITITPRPVLVEELSVEPDDAALLLMMEPPPLFAVEPPISSVVSDQLQFKGPPSLFDTLEGDEERSRDLKTPTNENVVVPAEHPPLTKKRSTPRENVGQIHQPTDIFTSLDPLSTGRVDSQDLQSYLRKNSLQELEYIVNDVKKDKDGRLKTRDLALQLEKVVYDKENPITRSVLLTYKKEISKLRNWRQAEYKQDDLQFIPSHEQFSELRTNGKNEREATQYKHMSVRISDVT